MKTVERHSPAEPQHMKNGLFGARWPVLSVVSRVAQ